MRKIIAISVASLSLTVMASPRAATITTSLSAWQSAVGGTYGTTTNFGYNDGDSASSLNLVDGQTLTFGYDTVYNTPGTFTLNGYAGQVIDTGFADETITLSSPLYALGFIVQPGATVKSDITVTLSDGTTTTLPAVNFEGAGATQFIGYYGTGIDSIEVSFQSTDDNGNIDDQNQIVDFAFGNIVDVVSTPEPMSMALLLSGVTGLGLIRRRHG